MTRLFDVTYPDGRFLMRASLRGLSLFVPLSGPEAARVVLEQVAQKKWPEYTVVWSDQLMSCEYRVRLAVVVLGHEVD